MQFALIENIILSLFTDLRYGYCSVLKILLGTFSSAKLYEILLRSLIRSNGD